MIRIYIDDDAQLLRLDNIISKKNIYIDLEHTPNHLNFDLSLCYDKPASKIEYYRFLGEYDGVDIAFKTLKSDFPEYFI